LEEGISDTIRFEKPDDTHPQPDIIFPVLKGLLSDLAKGLGDRIPTPLVA
jgi:hypothetical protein